MGVLDSYLSLTPNGPWGFSDPILPPFSLKNVLNPPLFPNSTALFSLSLGFLGLFFLALQPILHTATTGPFSVQVWLHASPLLLKSFYGSPLPEG